MPTRAVLRYSMSRGSLCALSREAFGSSVALCEKLTMEKREAVPDNWSLPYETPKGRESASAKLKKKYGISRLQLPWILLYTYNEGSFFFRNFTYSPNSFGYGSFRFSPEVLGTSNDRALRCT